MPEAVLRAKLTGDSAEFQRSLREGMNSAKEFGQEVGRRMRETLLEVAGLTIGVESIGEAFEKTFEGIKGVFELSKDLEHLSDRTGIATRDLVQLQTEFKLSGLEADQVGTTINRMQRSIENAADKGGTAAEAFTRLGLNIHALQQMDPAAQFEALRKGIAGIEDPARRAQAAIAIFGRQGAEMLSLFKNGAVGEEAANALGTQADILARNSQAFQEVASDMEAAGIKIQGFFVGLAEPISHVILPVLNKLESIDLTKWGAQIGDTLATSVRALYDAFSEGKLSELVKLSFQVAFQESGNFLAGVLKADATAFGDIILDIFSTDFATHLGQLFVGVAEQFGGAIMRALQGPLNVLQSTISYQMDRQDALSNARAAMKNAAQYDSIADEAFKKENLLVSQGDSAGVARQASIADDATNKSSAARDDAKKFWQLQQMSLQEYIDANKDNPATFFGLNSGDWTNKGKDDAANGAAGLGPIMQDAVSKALADVGNAKSVNVFGDSSGKLNDLLKTLATPIPGEGKQNAPDAPPGSDAGGIDKTFSRGALSGIHQNDDGNFSFYSSGGLGAGAVNFGDSGSAGRAGRVTANPNGPDLGETVGAIAKDIAAIKSQLATVSEPE